MYVLSGIQLPIRVAAPKKSSMPVPAFRTPTGLQSWWRPVAVGFPNTGSSASYIGPRTAAPGLHVGVEAGSLIPVYMPQYRGATLVKGGPTPLVPTNNIQPGSNVVMTTAGPVRLPPGAWIHPFSPALVPGTGL